MVRAGIDLDVMRNLVTFQLDVEFLAHAFAEISLRVWANYRPQARNGFQRVGIRAVIRRNGVQAFVGGGPGNDEAAAHAEANRTDTPAVHTGLPGQEGERRFHVVNTGVIE